MSEPQQTYLGDAVYAVELPDGSIALRLNDHRNSFNQIVMEERTLDAFENFRKHCKTVRQVAIALEDFQPGMKVVYMHDRHNPRDCDKEQGIVSSKNNRFVFVKFPLVNDDRPLDEIGSQACNPLDLKIIPPTAEEPVE